MIFRLILSQGLWDFIVGFCVGVFTAHTANINPETAQVVHLSINQEKTKMLENSHDPAGIFRYTTYENQRK